MTTLFGVFEYGYIDISSVKLGLLYSHVANKDSNHRKDGLNALTERSDTRERICASRHGKSMQRLDIKSSSGS
jgi:hypothetical protein